MCKCFELPFSPSYASCPKIRIQFIGRAIMNASRKLTIVEYWREPMDSQKRVCDEFRFRPFTSFIAPSRFDMPVRQRFG